MIRPSAPLAALLLLAGCASGTDGVPSLLPREAEDQSFDAPVPVAAPAAAPDRALDSQIAALTAERTAATRAFADADKCATAQLGAGARAAIGSEPWLDAQTALAALDEQRATMLSILTRIEELAIGRAAAQQPTYPALEAARVDTEAELDRIAAIVAERKAALPL